MLVGLLDELGIPAWLSFTVDGDCTRAGQPLSEAFAVAAGADAVIAVGVNCCAPADVLPQSAGHEVTGKPGVAYPNSGQGWDAHPHVARRLVATTSPWRPPGPRPARRTSAGAAASAPTTSPPWPRASPDDGSPSYLTCGQMEPMTSRIAHTTVDAHDAHAQSVWWADLLGYHEDPRTPTNRATRSA